MRNFTYVVAAAALALSTTTQAQVAPVAVSQHLKTAASRLAGMQKAVKAATTMGKAQAPRRAATAADLWLPTHDVEYSYDEGDWSKEAENTYTYDASGNPLSQVQFSYGSYTKLVNTYNSDGKVVEQHAYLSEDGSNYTELVKRSQQYDERTGVVTMYDAYSFDTDENAWTRSGGANKFVIERNADGNVTSCTYYTINDDKENWDEAYKLVYTYPAGGNAPTQCVYTEGNVTVTYSDMVWAKCNGQLTTDLGDGWVTGDNVLVSTNMKEVEGEDSYDYNITAEADANGDFRYFVKLAGNDYLMLVLYKKTTDANGSFKVGQSTYANRTGGSVTYDDKYLYAENQYTVCNVDAQGNITLQEEYEADEDTKVPTLYDGTKYEYKYEGPHGEMTESVQYDYDGSSAYVPYVKTEYSQFVNAASAAGVQGVTDAAKGVTEYYNLQGMKVNTTAKRGLYIMKQNGKTVKVLK